MPGDKKKPRGYLLGCLSFLSVVFLLAASVLAIDVNAFLNRPVVDPNQTRQLIIPEGTSWPGVVKILRDEGFISRPLYFEVWARQHQLPQNVKAGRFQLTGPVSLQQLAEHLQKGGEAEEISLTVPEGFSIFLIADRIDAAGIASRAEFLRAARDPEALKAAGIPGESFEGYLFPDTYRFFTGVSASEIIQTLHKRHLKVWNELLAAHPGALEQAARLKLSNHDLVTLASLVEKESSANAERPLIARVFLNRLQKNMRLQTDPTCVYAEDTYRAVPHPKYCKDPLNRYSTYVIDGLPPGPIANPGRSSLVAALKPDTSPEAQEFLFFVARRDGSGRHHFTKTYDEHRQAVRQFLK